MNRWVVDASVALKWFLPEVHSAEAVRLLRDDYLLFAPDLIWAEFGNVLWKKWRRREIEADVARRLLEDSGGFLSKCVPPTPCSRAPGPLRKSSTARCTTVSTWLWRKVRAIDS